jgi:hypothetical protein
VANKDAIFIAFDEAAGRWLIQNQSGAPMPANAVFC